MIKHLELVNYRSHEHTSFDLEPLTVFIGPAAGGKSNIFRALVRLQNAMIRTPAEIFGLGPWSIWAEGYRGNPHAAITFKAHLDRLGEDFDGQQAIYSLWLNEGSGIPIISEERLERRHADPQVPNETVFHRGLQRRHLGEFGDVEPEDRTVVGTSRSRQADQSWRVRFAAAVGLQLSRFGYFHLEAAELSNPSRIYDPPERVGYTGSDLPGALATLREKPGGEESFRNIVDQMREILPALEDILLVPVGDDRLGIGLKHKGFEGHITPKEASDGTLFTLGLLTVIHQSSVALTASPSGPTSPVPLVLALEEPETGLHPGRLQWLADKLWDLAHGRVGPGPVQVLVSTHSPYLLDRFQDAPEVIRVVQCVAGKTRVAALTEIAASLHITEEELRRESLGRQWYAGIFEEVGEPVA